MAWFTKVAIWVAARLTCFRARARAQRSGTRNRDRREADYEYDYEHDFKRESCDPELNQARNFNTSVPRIFSNALPALNLPPQSRKLY